MLYMFPFCPICVLFSFIALFNSFESLNHINSSMFQYSLSSVGFLAILFFFSWSLIMICYLNLSECTWVNIILPIGNVGNFQQSSSMHVIFNLYANYCQVLISTCYEFLNTFLFFYFKKVNYLFQQFRKDKNSFMLTHIFTPFSLLAVFTLSCLSECPPCIILL